MKTKRNESNIDLKEKSKSIIDLINKNRRILLVDDEPYNIMGLWIMIEKSGYHNINKLINCAYNG